MVIVSVAFMTSILLMAVPKKRTSRSKKRRRLSNWKGKATKVTQKIFSRAATELMSKKEDLVKNKTEGGNQ